MILKLNSKGEDVKKLQTKLGLTPDGIFGAGTEKKVKEWQSANGLTPDGIVGDGTWSKMFPTTSTKPEIVKEDVVITKTSNFKLEKLKGHIPDSVIAQILDTAQKFKPTSPGSYTIKTTQNGCISALSNPYYYLVTDIINLSKDEFIKLAPNPFINQLIFDFIVKGYQRLNLEVFDIASGTKVASQPNLTAGSRITLGHLSSGAYVIRVTSTDNKISYQFKMVKL
jgi:peptidoglycan hydrolase-like protein with peptidoglycan-binding domain